MTAICRRLDALPLALELAAPWIKVLTPEDLLRRLERDVLLSTVGRPRDLPERQQTMNATVAWSYQLLAPRRAAGVPPSRRAAGTFPIEAAAAVLAGRERCSGRERSSTSRGGRVDRQEPAAARRDLRGRVAPAVPDARNRAGVTRLLELTAAGERDDALEGLARYCAAKHPSRRKGWSDPRRSNGWIGCVTISRTTAARWPGSSIAGRASRSGRRSRRDCCIFWVIRGHAAEGLRWYRTDSDPAVTVARRRSRESSTAPPLMSYAQGELERARTALGRALALAQRVGDHGRRRAGREPPGAR